MVNNIVYIEDNSEQPHIEVGLDLPLTVNSMVLLIKNEVERLKQSNPHVNVRKAMENYLNMNFVSQNSLNGDASYTKNYMSRVLRNIMKAFKLSFRAFKELEGKIHEGINHIDQRYAHFVSIKMAEMSDEQLEQFDLIHQLMGKQIQALQRLRSAKISGLREVIILMNDTLHVYQNNELEEAFSM